VTNPAYNPDLSWDEVTNNDLLVNHKWAWDTNAVGAIIVKIEATADLTTKTISLDVPFKYAADVTRDNVNFTGARMNEASSDSTYFKMNWQEKDDRYAFFDNNALGYVNPGKITNNGIFFNEGSFDKANVDIVWGKTTASLSSIPAGYYTLKGVITAEPTDDVWIAVWRTGASKTPNPTWAGFLDSENADLATSLDTNPRAGYVKVTGAVPARWTWTITKSNDIEVENTTDANKCIINKFQIDGLGVLEYKKMN